MSDPTSSRDRDGESSEIPPGMPRWVKVSALVAAVVVILLLVIMLLVGGEHGPGLHTGAGDPSSVVGWLTGVLKPF